MNERIPDLDERWEKVLSSANPRQVDVEHDFLRELRKESARVFCETTDGDIDIRRFRLTRQRRWSLLVGLSSAAAVVACVAGWIVATRPAGNSVVRNSQHVASENPVRLEGDLRVDMPTSQLRLRRAWDESEERLWELLDSHALARTSPPSEKRTAWLPRDVLLLEHETERTQ